MRAVVTNASPLIILARADLLELLLRQFSTILVPQAVVEEVLQGPENDPMRKLMNGLPWLNQITLEPPLTPLAYWQLGRGESEVIEYARRHQGTVALLDDKDARKVASALQIPVIGTLGVVARSARHGGMYSLDQMIERLQEAGIYLDQRIISKVRKSLEKGTQ